MAEDARRNQRLVTKSRRLITKRRRHTKVTKTRSVQSFDRGLRGSSCLRDDPFDVMMVMSRAQWPKTHAVTNGLLRKADGLSRRGEDTRRSRRQDLYNLLIVVFVDLRVFVMIRLT